MAKSKRLSEKTTQLLRAAGEHGDARLKQALRVYRRLTRQEQRAVVFEIVATRAEELRRAHLSITAVVAGYRRRGAAASERDSQPTTSSGEVLTHEPAVVFQVFRKWSSEPRTERTRRKRLPEVLYTFITCGNGERALCAVPTDVTQVRGAGRPEASRRNTQICVASPKDQPIARTVSEGMLGCIILMKPAGSGGEPRHFVAGCHHVFARSLAGSRNGLAARTPIQIEWPNRVGKRTVLAQTHKGWLGKLQRASMGPSFDAALAELRQGPEIRRGVQSALAASRALRTLRAMELPPVRAEALTARGSVTLRYPELVRPCSEIDYFQEPSNRPVHPELIRWRFLKGERTREGDSGSPVVSTGSAMPKLLGIHLGSRQTNGTVYAYTLPIYFVLNAVNYGKSSGIELRHIPFL